MKLLRTAAYVAAFFGVIGAGNAAAQNGGGTVQQHTQNEVTYVSGGVGEEQQEQMQQLAQQGYTLKLVFAEKGTGAYVADVRVIVADANGRTLLDTVADGPAFYARVPEGDYRVTVEYRGTRQTRRVHA